MFNGDPRITQCNFLEKNITGRAYCLKYYLAGTQKDVIVGQIGLVR